MGNCLKGEHSRLIAFRGACVADFSKPFATADLTAPLFGEVRHAR
jgi:hypothetical protein